jgi:hypothetical protein
MRAGTNISIGREVSRLSATYKVTVSTFPQRKLLQSSTSETSRTTSRRMQARTYARNLAIEQVEIKRRIMATILGAFIIGIALSSWFPVISQRKMLRTCLVPILLSTLSCVLQLLFVVCVAKFLLTLDYSLWFASFGVPCCIGVLLLLRRSRRPGETPKAIVVSASLGLVMWAMLVTLH